MGKTVFDPPTPGQKEIGGGHAGHVAGGFEERKIPTNKDVGDSCAGHITPQVAASYKYSDDFAPTGDKRPLRLHHAGGLQPADGVLRPGQKSARSTR